MATAQTTTNYGLPIFAGTDKGNWFDFNNGFQAIDAAIKAAADAATAAQTAAQAANTAAQAAQSVASTTNTALTQLSSDIQNWTGSIPTNANSTYFQNPANSAVFMNRQLNLLNIRISVNLVSGQSFPANTKIVNLNQTIGVNADRKIAYAMICYQSSENVRYCQALTYTLNHADNTLSIDAAASSLPNFDATKPAVIYINQTLCTDGWFD